MKVRAMWKWFWCAALVCHSMAFNINSDGYDNASTMKTKKKVETTTKRWKWYPKNKQPSFLRPIGLLLFDISILTCMKIFFWFLEFLHLFEERHSHGGWRGYSSNEPDVAVCSQTSSTAITLVCNRHLQLFHFIPSPPLFFLFIWLSFPSPSMQNFHPTASSLLSRPNFPWNQHYWYFHMLQFSFPNHQFLPNYNQCNHLLWWLIGLNLVVHFFQFSLDSCYQHQTLSLIFTFNTVFTTTTCGNNFAQQVLCFWIAKVFNLAFITFSIWFSNWFWRSCKHSIKWVTLWWMQNARRSSWHHQKLQKQVWPPSLTLSSLNCSIYARPTAHNL
jgi:hypothetical protein